MPSTRRTVLLGGVTLLAGCVSTETGGQQTTEQTTQTNTQTRTQTSSPTESTPTDTSTHTPKPDVFTPDETLSFGDSDVVSGLELTVDTPTIETTFDSEGETYTMPDGRALAFAPLTFYNSSDEARGITGKMFTLLDGETTIRETYSVTHPEFDPSVGVEEMDDVQTTNRWWAEGSTVEPDEQLSGTAVFEVSETIDSSALRVVLDWFEDKIISWTT